MSCQLSYNAAFSMLEITEIGGGLCLRIPAAPLYLALLGQFSDQLAKKQMQDGNKMIGIEIELSHDTNVCLEYTVSSSELTIRSKTQGIIHTSTQQIELECLRLSLHSALVLAKEGYQQSDSKRNPIFPDLRTLCICM